MELRSPVDGPTQTLFSAQTLLLAYLPLSRPDRGRGEKPQKGPQSWQRADGVGLFGGWLGYTGLVRCIRGVST